MSAIAAKIAISVVRNLGCAVESWRTSVIVAISVTGRSLSSAATDSRIDEMTALGASVLCTAMHAPGNGDCA